MAQTDVTVIVPVYNTMPYLEATLESLVRQTNGLDPLQVVAVDDGSTDGSGDLLDRYAARFPDTFTVLHQPNSGGPATPCNRGLDLAEGRYVFFLGADDYLGDEALERLVTRADEWDSDVIFGRIEGVGGRGVYQGVFEETRRDLDIVESELAYSLNNVKLFRRSMLDEHGIRYAHDLRVGSDQPFTIEAMLHARRISVLADYTYYFAVKREDSSNITFSHRWHQRTADIGAIMRHVAEVVPPGEVRDAIFRRHFAMELYKTLREDLRELPETEQKAAAGAVAELANAYLTDGIARRLGVLPRLLHRLAQAGDVATMHEVLRAHEAGAPYALEGDRVFVAFPGFRDARGLPDAWFEMRQPLWRSQLRELVATGRVRLVDGGLRVRGTVGLTATSTGNPRLVLRPVPEDAPLPLVERFERYAAPPGPEQPVAMAAAPGGANFHADVPLGALEPGRWAVRLRVDASGATYEMMVPFRRAGQPKETTVTRGVRRGRLDLAVAAAKGRRKALELVAEPTSLAETARRVLRRDRPADPRPTHR
ncbi:MAG: glycosyltransferase family 2 protein [Nocardioidaceae bacterium]